MRHCLSHRLDSFYLASRGKNFWRYGLALVWLLLSPVVLADLGASVTVTSGQPLTISPGQTTQLEITLSNSNTSAAITGAAFSNSLPSTLPNGLRIAGAAVYQCTDPATNATSAGSGTLTAALNTQSISLSGGVIPARANNTDGICTIRIPVTAGTSTGNSATYTYTIASGAVTGNDGGPVANSGVVNQSINVLAFAAPTITKSFSNSTLVLGGAPETLTIVIANDNSVPISGVGVTDTFPLISGQPIVVVASAPTATSVCTSGGTPLSFTPVADAPSVSGSGGTIPANGSCTLTVRVRANTTGSSYQTSFVQNTIVGATDFTSSIGIIPANAQAPVAAISPFAVTKNFANGAIASGQTDDMVITLTNNGNTPLTVTGFTDSPIDGVGDSGFGLKVNGSPNVVCSSGGSAGTYAATAGNLGIIQTGNTTIAAGGTCTITTNFTATVQTANTPIAFTNTIAEGSITTSTAGIVSQGVTSSILVSDTLRVLKAAQPAIITPGNPVRYQVTVENWSNSVINNVVIDDTLTNGQTFLTGTISGTDFTPALSGAGCSGLSVSGALGTTTPSFTIATLPARSSSFAAGSCTVTFWAMTSISAANNSAVSNVLAAGTVCYNSGATCNGGSSGAVSGSINSAPLTVSKQYIPAGPLSEGTISRLRITLSNLSARAMTSVSVSDSLPVGSGGAQLRIASPANAASTCGTPTITAAPNGTSLTMNGATIPARASGGLGAAGTCILEVDIVGAAGTYTNTVAAAGTQVYANGTTASVGPVTSANATITYNSALSATKSFSPSNVASGGKSRVLIRLSNSSGIALTGVGVTDPLPSGMVLANPTGAYTTCSGTTAISGASGASSISLAGADIAPGGSCDLVFDVAVTGTADWVNTIPVGNIVANGGVTNQVAVSGTLTFNAPSGITVAMATNPSTLTFPGQVSQLTITLTNGTQAVTGLGLTDYFTINGTSAAALNGIRVGATPAVATTCPSGLATATPNGTSVQLTGANLAASASCTITVNVTSTTVGGVTNFIPAGSIVTDQGLSNSGQATTSLTTQSNIGITKQFTPRVIKPGERSRLRINLLNPSAQPAANANFTDNFPSGLVVAASPNPVSTCSGATITTPTASQLQIVGANVPAASGGAAATCFFEIDVTAASAGSYVNTIATGALTATVGGAPAVNSQPATDTLRVLQPVVIHQAITNLTLDSGNPAGFTTGSDSSTAGTSRTLTIVITNPNATALTGAAFTQLLPTGLVVAQTPNASTTCAGGTVTAQPSGTAMGLTGATLAANASCTVTLSVLSNISGAYTTTIPAGGLTTFEGASNEEPTQARLIIAQPPVVRKEFSPAVIPSGGISRLSIIFDNPNAAAITLTSSFVDTLPVAPGSVLIASTPNLSTTCPASVTAAANSNTISYPSAGTIPAVGCSISVDVVASVPGTYTNTIPAGALQTNAGNNQQPANASLVVSTQGYIAGRVFADNNVSPNGTYQLGVDQPLSGVTVNLHTGSGCSGSPTATTTTDVNGTYLFSGLAAGTYSVCEPTQPTGTSNGITTAGGIIASGGSTGTAGTASNPTTTTSQILGIVLNGDGAGGEISGSTGNNFAEVIPSSISGRVFLDQNNNGVQNGPDTGINGVTVQLLNSSNVVVATQVTNSLGDYSFTGLQPGTYTVVEPTQPANTTNGITTAGTVPNGGTAGTATAIGVTPSAIATIIVPPNTASVANNFAEIPNGRTISGRVFLDFDNSGIPNGPDYGLAGVTLTLTGTDVNGNTINRTVTTGADGSYSFVGLPEGTYTINQTTQPAGTSNGTTTAGSTGGTANNPTAGTSRIASVNLTGTNTFSGGNNFAELPGAAPDLTISKSHAPVSFGAGSSTGVFTLTPRNVGAAATSGVITITDTLPSGMTLAAAATGNGWNCVGAVGSTTITCTSNQVIAPNTNGTVINLRVLVASSATGQLLTNTAVIAGGGEPAGLDGNNTATDTVAIAASAQVSGTVWRDLNHDRVLDTGEPRLPDWGVELVLNGVVVQTATTGSNGVYQFTGVSPGSGYQIRFREPQTGLIFGNAVTNEQGIVPTDGSRDGGAITPNSGTNSGNPAGADLSARDGTLGSLTLLAGDNIIQQSLPVDPAGVVYDAVTRNPVAGAVVTITGPAGFNPAIHLVGGTAVVTTGADGLYQFLLTPTAPAGVYNLAITTYPGGYLQNPSALIPVCTGTLTVGPTPDPALVQSSNFAPALAAPVASPATCPTTTTGLNSGNQGSTQHYFSFNIDPTTAADLLNNHIPIDPIQAGAIIVTKTTPLVNVTIGQLVPYTITVRNTTASVIPANDVVDTLPPGFKYKVGSATRDGVPLEPVVQNRMLRWNNQTLNGSQTVTYKLLLVVGAGVQPGEYINTVQAFGTTSLLALSDVATATVRVVPDPLFDCSEIIGKVFDDANANGYHDEGEKGVPNIRLATVNGELITTDEFGRYHIACAAIPHAERGSNYILKLDERTLPTGYRVTTENPETVRLTRGKMSKLNFGVTIHKVVRVDMQDRAFVAGETTLRPEWLQQLERLPEQLKDRPSVLRLSYQARAEDQELARRRLREVANSLRERWKDKGCCHLLQIEEELVLPSAATRGQGGRP
jgi:large repetitive protein